MLNQFAVGETVKLIYFELVGKIISIELAPDFEFLENSEEDVVLYKMEISQGCYVTTTIEGLEKIKPERISDEQ